MSESLTYRESTRQLRLGAYWAAAVLTLLIFIAVGLHYREIGDSALELARIQAAQSFEKDVVYRSWSAAHGGVYAPPSEQTPPNPYLSQDKNRDIESVNGLRLTLINPAYMTRQAHELGRQRFGHLSHITSLKPIRPENAADAWETEALRAFERGVEEVSELTVIEGEQYLRWMRPLITEKSCLKCHGKQGYEEGDIRGGISIAVPMAPLRELMFEHVLIYSAAFGGFWLLALGGIVFGVLRMEHRIHERDRAQAALRERESMQSKVFRITPIGIGLISKRVFAQVNPHFCRMLGYDSAELLGNSTRMVYPSEQEFERVGADILRQIEAQGCATLETRLMHKSGRVFDVSLSARPMDLSDPDAGIAFTVFDISERKQMEAALHESEEKYKALYENAPLPYQSLDVSGCVIDVNPAWLKTLGYQREAVIGRWFGDFLDAPSRELFKERFEQFKQQGCVHDVPFGIRHAKGHYLQIVFEGCIGYTPDNQFKQTYCVFQDITQRRQAERALRASEAQLRTLVETLPDLVWLKDAEGVYLSCNPKFERFFGAKQAQIVGKTDYDFVDKTLADAFRKNDLAAIAAGKPCMNVETVTYAIGGNQEVLETLKTPMFAADGGLIGVLGIAREITRRHKAEADLAIQLEELRRWHAVTVGREGRVLELKQEVNRLLEQQGQAPRYSSVQAGAEGVDDV